MKGLVLTLLLSSTFALAQVPPDEVPSQDVDTIVLPGERAPLPSQRGKPIPGEIPPEKSRFEKAVEEASAVPKDVHAEEIVYANKKTTRDLREGRDHTVMLGYQLLSSWLPSKKAVSYTYLHSADWSYEFEYAWQKIDSPIIGIDLGEIDERRYSLMARRYVGNSFHFIFGPVYQDFHARAGGSIANQGLDVATFGAENLGALVGIGNRWQWENGITLGIDWLRINVPIVTTKIENEILKDINNSEDSDDVKKVIRTFNRIPTFVVFGLNLGYSF